MFAKGDGNVHQINAQSLVNTLALLRAVRWIGPGTPEDGLENPALTVSFKTESTSGRLFLGAITPEEMTRARVEGLNGTFEISRPDKEAFEMPLLDKRAASTPPPAATPEPAKP